MAFIKVENIVINTHYIAAVKLKSQTCSGENCTSILMATPKIPLLQVEESFPNAYHYEWLDFTGRTAEVLQDYFSSFNNVLDLMPQYQ